jgi:hypothetical protein
MKNVACSLLFAVATISGLIQNGADGQSADRSMVAKLEAIPSVPQSDEAAPGPASDDCRMTPSGGTQTLQVASEIGQLKKVDLLMARGLQQTQADLKRESDARSLLASDVQGLLYEKQRLSRELADLRSQLQTKADQTEVERINAELSATRDDHQRLIENLESQLTQTTTRLAEVSETVTHVAEKPTAETVPAVDTLLYSFNSTAGAAEFYERSGGNLEVELNGTRHPVMIRPSTHRCSHVRTVKRNLTSATHGELELGYVDHWETLDGRRVQVKGYVVFIQD